MKGIYKKTAGDELKRKLQLFKQLQAEPYERKVEFARKIIQQALKTTPAAVLYSGGKDSSVLLRMAIEQNEKILILYNDTGLADPRLLSFIEAQTKNLNFIRVKGPDPIETWKRWNNFPILPKRTFNKYKQRIPGLKIQPIMCCYHLKEKPARDLFRANGIQTVLWGNRAGESNRRKFAAIDHGFLIKPKRSTWQNAYPLQHFTDADIRKFLKENDIQRPDEEQLETGCMACATDITYWPNNLSRLYNKNRPLWEKYMRAGFAAEILKIKRLDLDPEKIIMQNPEKLLKIEPGYQKIHQGTQGEQS